MPGKPIFDIGWAVSYNVVTNGFEWCPSHAQFIIMIIAMAPITCTIIHKILKFLSEINESKHNIPLNVLTFRWHFALCRLANDSNVMKIFEKKSRTPVAYDE